MEKGQVFKIDRWYDGNIQTYTVKRACRMHINVQNDNERWAMPYFRIKDCELLTDALPSQI